MTTFTLNRRAFLQAGVALAAGRSWQPQPLKTLTDWLEASPPARRIALPALLAHIRATEPSVQAWVQVAPRPSSGRGPLAEIPFGVKDVLETTGLLTEYGSPIYTGRRGTEDAAIVRTLCDLGGVLLGKTHTAAFAFRTPPPTHNPRDLAHTPGGSSSGSAAAVAADMTPLAIGTQTGGSTIRPASYCGVTGFKVSYGLLPTQGVLEYSKSLDTLGFFTHRAVDMLAFWQQVLGREAGQREDVPLAVMDPLPEIEASMQAAFKGAVSRLRAAGVPIRSADIGGLVLRLHDAQQTVSYYEGARAHAERFEAYGDRLLDLANLVRKGRDISESSYREARVFIARARGQVDEMCRDTPLILSPAATGPAPQGLAFTGNSSLNSAWTALGTPAITIPMPAPGTLPLGLQITAPHGQDARVLQAAVRIEALFPG